MVEPTTTTSNNLGRGKGRTNKYNTQCHGYKQWGRRVITTLVGLGAYTTKGTFRSCHSWVIITTSKGKGEQAVRTKRSWGKN